MSNLTLGMIGVGNMGGAILRGLRPHRHLNLVATDHSRSKVEALNANDWQDRVTWADTALEVAAKADIIVLGVKPWQIADLAASIRPELNPDKIVVSIAAKVNLETIAQALDQACPTVRVMPNLPVVVGKGCFGLCVDDPALSQARQQVLVDLFSLLGRVIILPEAKFSAFAAVVGSGPAYACLFMEGVQNAAISLGFTADQAKELVAATTEGTAALALHSAESFADLRAKVCSPAGITIQAVNHLERTAVRGHVTDAVLAAFQSDLGKS